MEVAGSRCIGVGTIVAALIVYGQSSGAQASSEDRTRGPHAVVAVPVDSSMLPLPVPRRLRDSLPLDRAREYQPATGQTVAGVGSIALALQDLQQYDGRLETLFPWSAAGYPADSIRRLQVARAATWLAYLRVRTTRSDERGDDAIGLAMIAMRAEQDSLARRYLDERLAYVRSVPAEASLVLAAGVALFANPVQDSARAERNYALADAYAGQLIALPATGYAMRSDSLSVRQRQQMALLQLWRDVEMLYPADTASAAATSIDKLTQMLPPAERNLIVSITGDRKRVMRNVGQGVPPLVAHAWLNTADSLYAATPRPHALNDGTIRAIMFGDRTTEEVSALERVQHDVPAGVQVVFVTETMGYVGPDLLTPEEEVAWTRDYYERVRHLTIPIAVWAGKKMEQDVEAPAGGPIVTGHGAPVAASASSDSVIMTAPSAVRQPAGRLTRQQPNPSPLPAAYAPFLHDSVVILVDGYGCARGYQPVTSDAQVQQLVRRLTALRNASRTN